MKFVVGGAWQFNVGISEKPLLYRRRRVKGLCDPDAGTIQICRTVKPDRRMPVLMHELAHAWFRSFNGVPTDEETLCDFVGAFAVATMRWLQINGGQTAILRLEPGEMLQPATARIMLTTARSCATCRTSVAAGSVDARPDGKGQVQLALYCDFCEHLQMWTENADVNGQPNGQQVADFRYDRGEKMQEHLKEHAEHGVTMVYS